MRMRLPIWTTGADSLVVVLSLLYEDNHEADVYLSLFSSFYILR